MDEVPCKEKSSEHGETSNTTFEFCLNQMEKMASGEATTTDDGTASVASLLRGDDDEELCLADDDEWENHDAFIPVPKAKSPDEDLVPCSVMLCRTFNNQTSSRLLRVLLTVVAQEQLSTGEHFRKVARQRCWTIRSRPRQLKAILSHALQCR